MIDGNGVPGDLVEYRMVEYDDSLNLERVLISTHYSNLQLLESESAISSFIARRELGPNNHARERDNTDQRSFYSSKAI